MSSDSDQYIRNIQLLLENGCTESDAIRLLSEHPDVDEALEKFWEEQFGELGQSAATNPYDVFGSSSDDDSDDDPYEFFGGHSDDLEIKILQLMNMGYSRESCEFALIGAGNDVLMAVQILSSNVGASDAGPVRGQVTMNVGEEKEMTQISPRRPVGPSRSSRRFYNSPNSPDSPDSSDSSESEGEELLLTASEEDGRIEFLIDPESISRVIWPVGRHALPPWCISYYDKRVRSLIFYVGAISDSLLIRLDGNRVSLDMSLFTDEYSLSQVESQGIYLTRSAAEYVPSLRGRRNIAHAHARNAYEGLRPRGGEWKNDYDPLCQSSLGDSVVSIREALEFKLRDVSDRVSEARARGIPERNLLRFSRAAFEYITCVLDISLIRLRNHLKTKVEDPLYWAKIKARARHEGWNRVKWDEFFGGLTPESPTLRQRSEEGHRSVVVPRVHRRMRRQQTN